MGNYTIFWMFENPRRGRQARNFGKNVPKILDLKSSSEQISSENCRWVPLTIPPRLAGKIVKNCPFSQPIRLEDLEDSARSQASNRARGPYWGILALRRGSNDQGPIFPNAARASSASKLFIHMALDF